MDINTLIFLAKCCINGRGYDMMYDQEAIAQFIMSFSNLSHPLAKRSHVHAAYGNGLERARLGLQYHLSHLAPMGSADLIPLLETEGLVLERQSFRIQRVSHVPTQLGDKKKDDEQFFEERILSLSLMISERRGTFYIIALGDQGVNVNTSHPESLARDGTLKRSFRLDPKALGKAAGFSYFLIALVELLKTSYHGWNETLDTIDNIVGFHVSLSLQDNPFSRQ